MSAPSERVRWGVVGMCFLAVLLDGFDAAALAIVIPSLVPSWGVQAAAFTPALVLTNIGVVAGYMLAGSLGARFGTRRVLAAAVVLVGIGSLITAAVLPAHSIALLSVVRIVTGLGLGVVLPTAVTLATVHNPPRRRQLVSVAVTLGLASGGAVAGVFGGMLLRSIGVSGIFWLGGGLPLVLAVVMLMTLPRTAPAVAPSTAAREAGVGRLFEPGMRSTTLLLWAFAFLVFIAAYTLQSWVPTLLTGFGFAPTDAPVGLAFLNIGGVVGGLVLLALAPRIGIAAALVVMPLFGVVAMVVASTAGLGGTGLLLLLACAGAGVTAGQIGQLTLAVALYPEGSRTTGVGWAAALGRIGSIVGPALAGVLLALALPGSTIVLLTTIPVLVAALCAGVLWRRPRTTVEPVQVPT